MTTVAGTLDRLTRGVETKCLNCGQTFTATLCFFCSDECLYAKHPELRPEVEKPTPEQQRAAIWEARLPDRQKAFDQSRLKKESVAKAKENGILPYFRPIQSVLLLGQSEACKTFIAFRMARQAHMSGMSTRFATASQLKDWWLNERERYVKHKMSPVLLVDDLGMEGASEGWRDEIYSLFDHREAEGKTTIVTANCDRDFLATRYSIALANRLFRMLVVQL